MQALLVQGDSDAPKAIHQGSLGDRVYEALLSQIISLKIAPGSRISIDALVREFGVSQTPIRAALIRLEGVGLVVKTHNIGYSAAPMPSRQRFEEMFDLRLMLEPYLAARAAERLSNGLREELARIAAAMAEPPGDDVKLAYGKFALQDARFHSWIANHAANELAAEALSRLHAHTHLFRLRFHSHLTEGAIKEHAEIVAALSSGDPERARDAMASHILQSRARMEPHFVSLESAA
ncbi:GntR family transcriptional regulator [Variovorax sp. KK3]|uniref:GntR family transcriptional regulator n=1 Tax=Variovorax sp. KK3 TaxID=1855728 RepID=UPI00097C6B24|nr:GntR family transcriptional regulator [Variovorax sp. KK3]